MEIYQSARKHGIADDDMIHAIDNAMVAADKPDGTALYLGPDRAGNLLEIITVVRDDRSEIAIHAMPMRRVYEPLLHEAGGADD